MIKISDDDPAQNESLKNRLLSRVRADLEDYFPFYDELVEKTEEGWPTWSQAMRMKALQDKKRILVADDTGVNGKTFTTVASKLELDKKEGKKHNALIISPNGGLFNAWAPSEVNRYAEYMRAPEQNVVTVEKTSDLERVNGDTDLGVINWEKLSVRPDSPRWRSLADAIERQGTEFFAFDEVHQGKGSGSLRGKTTQRLVEYTRDKYLMLLSATPIPNRYRDLGMIFHMLDPDKYPSPTMFAHAGPDVIKELLERQAWFRLTREDLKEELGLPDFHEAEPHIVNLRDDEAEAYFKSWADCVLLGEGLTELRKTLYDPRLSKYGASMGIRQNSSKLEALAELTNRLRADGQKVLIHTSYVTDIVDQIQEAASRTGEALVVTGNTLNEQRSRAYWQFRNTGPETALVISSVAEESVDLTTGDQPATIINVEPKMTPREHTQLTGRVYRRGQRAPVTNINLVTQSPVLNDLMTSYLGELAQKYDIKVPKKFRPRTIDEDMVAMRRAKEDTVIKIYGGERPTRKEISVYDAQEVDRAVTHLEGLVTPTVFKDIGPSELSAIIQTRWRNLGEDQFDRLVHSKGWRKWRNLYEDGWDGNASQATNEIVGRIVDDLEVKLGKSPVVVSIGDGRAYFPRATGRAAVGIDLDAKWLEQGKRDCDKRGIPYRFVVAPATETTLPNAGADAVVNAYTIFYLGQDDERSEVEQAVLETNRITKRGGQFIIALPYSIDDNVIDRWQQNMPAYGFREIGYLGRNETKSDRMKSGCHIVTYEKTKNIRTPKDKDLSFYNNRRRFAG